MVNGATMDDRLCRDCKHYFSTGYYWEKHCRPCANGVGKVNWEALEGKE